MWDQHRCRVLLGNPVAVAVAMPMPMPPKKNSLYNDMYDKLSKWLVYAKINLL
jgi:hypothetical protein